MVFHDRGLGSVQQGFGRAFENVGFYAFRTRSRSRYETGEIVIQSDGTPWRPLVHVEDIAGAVLVALEAPRELVHNEAFNVGVQRELPHPRACRHGRGGRARCARHLRRGGGPDKRSYRVDCSKIARVVPGFEPRWTVRRGIEQLYEAYDRHGLTHEQFTGPSYLRIKRVQELQQAGRLATTCAGGCQWHRPEEDLGT